MFSPTAGYLTPNEFIMCQAFVNGANLRKSGPEPVNLSCFLMTKSQPSSYRELQQTTDLRRLSAISPGPRFLIFI
ncbi:hypothetical protein HNY73_006101 [Argiope bruennichi]|uniref:Uncharacterized protein n=1 Tax=Argiope bruennichi TaxID=94029 RepID=A0A8T0FIU8_ARGBR|nr:hypothetical protein HNY73_006101 [Argiope bruennichi]